MRISAELRNKVLQERKEKRHIKLLCRILTNKTDRKNRLFNTACLKLRISLFSHKIGNNKHNTLERKQEIKNLLSEVRKLRMEVI